MKKLNYKKIAKKLINLGVDVSLVTGAVLVPTLIGGAVGAGIGAAISGIGAVAGAGAGLGVGAAVGGSLAVVVLKGKKELLKAIKSKQDNIKEDSPTLEEKNNEAKLEFTKPTKVTQSENVENSVQTMLKGAVADTSQQDNKKSIDTSKKTASGSINTANINSCLFKESQANVSHSSSIRQHGLFKHLIKVKPAPNSTAPTIGGKKL